MTEARIALLTGPVGIGKTTVAERVAGLARRSGWVCGGLLAPAMVNSCGQKTGIWGADILSGERRVLARTDRSLGGPSIGPYSFDKAAFTWAVDMLEQAVGRDGLVIVDEIGKLELWQKTGLVSIVPRLAAGEIRRSLVLVRDSLLGELQARLGPVEQIVFEVNEDNRGELAPRILEQLGDPRPTSTPLATRQGAGSQTANVADKSSGLEGSEIQNTFRRNTKNGKSQDR
jgi:nucleoside-triphosphatase THEP1